MKHTTMGIPAENIYIITGFSSVDWEVQTKARLPQQLRPNVYHRNKLDRGFKDSIQGKSNVLILIDEVQIAAGRTHTLSKVFESLGFLDVEYLLKKKIKVVQFSATPNGTLYDGIDTLNEHYAITKLEASKGYHGVRHFYDNDRLKQFKPLSGSQYDPESMEELKSIIEANYPTPRYHIIRTPTGLGQYEVIVNMFGVRDANGKRIDGIFDEDSYDSIMYDMENYSNTYKINGETIAEIDYVLKKAPKKHTFVFLKEKHGALRLFQRPILVYGTSVIRKILWMMLLFKDCWVELGAMMTPVTALYLLPFKAPKITLHYGIPTLTRLAIGPVEPRKKQNRK